MIKDILPGTIKMKFATEAESSIAYAALTKTNDAVSP
jgi:hypothetical protein